MSEQENSKSIRDNKIDLSMTNSEEINLIDCLRVIYKYRWMILGITLLVMITTVVSSLCQPHMYQASASIVPPAKNRATGLIGKLDGTGSSLLQGMLSEGGPSYLYVGILESLSVANALVDRFDLTKTYANVNTKADACRILQGCTTIKASKDGIIRITVKDLDPNRAAAIANAYVEELDKQNRRLCSSQATNQRIFLENRLNEIQEELRQIERLQSREAQIKEMLFELLTKECEVAKIEEAKSLPTIQVLDSAIIPERGLGRGTRKKGMVAGVFALLFGVFLAFVCEYVRKIRNIETEGPCAVTTAQDISDKAVISKLESHRKIVATHRKKLSHEDKQYSQKS